MVKSFDYIKKVLYIIYRSVSIKLMKTYRYSAYKLKNSDKIASCLQNQLELVHFLSFHLIDRPSLQPNFSIEAMSWYYGPDAQEGFSYGVGDGD